MRCYMVKTTGCVRLAATGGEARAFRQAMVEEKDIKKKDVEIDPVELKTAKPELLAFLNGLLETVDDKEDFEMPEMPEGLQVIDKEAKKKEREAKKAVTKPAAKPAPKAEPTPTKSIAKKVIKPAPKKAAAKQPAAKKR